VFIEAKDDGGGGDN